MGFISFLRRSAGNMGGWSTRRRIVVFQSDDWGSIRMPSRDVYSSLREEGYPVHLRSFERFDCLESEEDLAMLFDVLGSVKDQKDRTPVFTANVVMANPDFEKIALDEFRSYHLEWFLDTYQKYYGSRQAWGTMKAGMSSGVFFPQFHGREHFNIIRWMNTLRNPEGDERRVFKYGVVGIPPKHDPSVGNRLMITLEYDSDDQLKRQKEELLDGARKFHEQFGFVSRSFIAPVYTWGPEIEACLSDCGVEFLQTGRFHRETISPGRVMRSKRHRSGQRTGNGQIYIVRNVFFEPSATKRKNYVEHTLGYIGNAFYWRKPAIISTHRLNYIGSIDPDNRQRNLQGLSTLLRQIVARWPDVEFLTTVELGDIIKNEIEK